MVALTHGGLNRGMAMEPEAHGKPAAPKEISGSMHQIRLAAIRSLRMKVEPSATFLLPMRVRLGMLFQDNEWTSPRIPAPDGDTSHPSSPQLSATVPQKLIKKGFFDDLCRSRRCAASAPIQPPPIANKCKVLSRVRHALRDAADLSNA